MAVMLSDAVKIFHLISSCRPPPQLPVFTVSVEVCSSAYSVFNIRFVPRLLQSIFAVDVTFETSEN